MRAYNALQKTNIRRRDQERRIRSGDDFQDPCEGCNKACKMRRLDFLGEPVNFNYKGVDTYESSLGATCSLLVAILMLCYVVNGLLHLYFSTPKQISQIEYFNTGDQPFYPFQLGYEFAIGFMGEGQEASYIQ